MIGYLGAFPREGSPLACAPAHVTGHNARPQTLLAKWDVSILCCHSPCQVTCSYIST